MAKYSSGFKNIVALEYLSGCGGEGTSASGRND